MLPAAQRLRRTSDIQNVYKTGRSVFTPVLRVLATATPLAWSRATVVVSTKVAKNATTRNRIKRRLRVDLRPLLTQMRTPHDVVVVVQPPAVKRKTGELTAAVQLGFNKLRLL